MILNKLKYLNPFYWGASRMHKLKSIVLKYRSAQYRALLQGMDGAEWAVEAIRKGRDPEELKQWLGSIPREFRTPFDKGAVSQCELHIARRQQELRKAAVRRHIAEVTARKKVANVRKAPKESPLTREGGE